jgi:hypothetical protein
MSVEFGGIVVLRLVIGDYRVQEVQHRDGTIAFTIVGPDGRVHPEAERFLARYAGAGTDRTYAYLLVDHLRWLECEGLTLGSVSVRDLQRYMGAVGAKVPMHPTTRAIDGLETALAELGLLEQALALDYRRPQDYFHRIWSTAFRATELAQTAGHQPSDTEQE